MLKKTSALVRVEHAILVMSNFEIRPLQKVHHLLKVVFKWWKERIAIHEPLDERKVKVGTKRQNLFVNLRATADENLAIGWVKQRAVNASGFRRTEYQNAFSIQNHVRTRGRGRWV